MKRFNAKDGLVSVIAEDVLAIQEAVSGNITDRLGIMIKRHGLKGDTSHTFDLSYSWVSGSTFEVQCANVGPVIFGDYLYVFDDSAFGTLSAQTTLSADQTKYIYLSRTINYTNDQEDNFEGGHPVDEDGNPPVSGYNIESEYALTLGVAAASSLPDGQIVILGTITRVGSSLTATIQDKRSDNALALEDFGLVIPNDDEIQDLTITPFFQNAAIRSRAASSSGTIDQTPSQVDMTANKLYLNVEWASMEDVFGYQVELQILDEQDRPAVSPTSMVVPHVDGEDAICAMLEVVPGLRYRVSVRSLASNPNHDPGPWTSENVYAGVPESIESEGVPVPELSVVSIHGDAESGTDTKRHLVKITAMAAESTPSPYFVQVFRLSKPLTGPQALADDAVLVYEGNAPAFLYDIPDGSTCYFAARTVGPGNACSSLVWLDEAFAAPIVVEPTPSEFAVRIPISAHWTKGTEPNPFKLTAFQAPAPYCRLAKGYFLPHGSAIITTKAGGDLAIGVELVVDQDGTFAFLDGEDNGKTAYTGRKMTWEGEDLRQLSSTTFVGGADDYYFGYNSMSFVDRGDSWEDDDEISVWLAVYDADALTSVVSLQGDLVLVFERTFEPVEGDDPTPDGGGRSR